LTPLRRSVLMMISRLPLKGNVLRKLLSKYYDVVWIGQTFPFKITLFNAFFIISLEFWKLLVNFRKVRFSAIIVQFVSLDGVAAIIFKRIFGTKIVLFAMGSDILKIRSHRISYPFIRKVIANSDVVFCQSTLIKKNVKNICPNVSKLRTVPSTLNFDDFESFNYSKEFDVITVGALNQNKNQMLLLEACRFLPSSVKVIIVGTGPMRKSLESISKTQGLSVSFEGSMTHKKVFQKLQQTRVYVHTSKSEGLPIAVLEAIFSGLPVILVENPYVYDFKLRYNLVVHIVNGDLPTNLANKICEVLRDYKNERRNALLNKKKIEKIIVEVPIAVKSALASIGV
jgi:glycosyltransferase involved in cell wall biosynthesis